MKALHASLLLAGLHTILVLSLGGRMLLDRATSPRCWARTGPVDPALPIRGRYVRLNLVVPVRDLERDPEAEGGEHRQYLRVLLEPDPAGLKARALPKWRGWQADTRGFRAWVLERPGQQAPSIATLDVPLAYFIPEDAPDPSRLTPGEELWVEVTLPRKGPPRPIRLAVRKDGEFKVITH